MAGGGNASAATASVTASALPSGVQQPKWAAARVPAPAMSWRPVPSGRITRTTVCSPPPGAAV